MEPLAMNWLFFAVTAHCTRYDLAWAEPVSHAELSLDHEVLLELEEELELFDPVLQELRVRLDGLRDELDDIRSPQRGAQAAGELLRGRRSAWHGRASP